MFGVSAEIDPQLFTASAGEILAEHAVAPARQEAEAELAAAEVLPANGPPVDPDLWSNLEVAERDAANAAADDNSLEDVEVDGEVDSATWNLDAKADSASETPDDGREADFLEVASKLDLFDPGESEAEQDDEVAFFNADGDLLEYSDFRFEIRSFDPAARQTLSDLGDLDGADILQTPRAKAAALAAQVDVASGRERQQLLVWLTELFQHLSHSMTFRALTDAASQGLTSETLRNMVALRNCWIEHPEWWVGRYACDRQPAPLRHGAAALTWALARRVCRARTDYPPEAMIDDDWLDEWFALPPGQPGYLSFPSYIDAKIGDLDAELLFDGLRQEAWSDSSELADQWDWHRRVPDREDVLRYGMRVLMPFDRRPDAVFIRFKDRDDDD